MFIEGISVEEVGGSPYAIWGNGTRGTYGAGAATAPGVRAATSGDISSVLGQTPNSINLYGDKIFISADFINIDGLMQSGKDNYTLTLGAQAQADINAIIASGVGGPVKLVNESNSDFALYFDTATRRIEVEDLRVSGGQIQMTGHVVDTGNGQIKVLGAYGTVNIVNNTSFDIGLFTSFCT